MPTRGQGTERHIQKAEVKVQPAAHHSQHLAAHPIKPESDGQVNLRFAQRFTICENLLKSVQTKFGRLCIRIKCDTLHLYIGKESDRPPPASLNLIGGT